MRRRTHRDVPARCSCMGGPNRAAEHSRPGKTTADHGDVFAHRGGCIHSELSHTTTARKPPRGVERLRLQ